MKGILSGVKPVEGERLPGLSVDSRLRVRKINGSCTVLLDPETVFWAAGKSGSEDVFNSSEVISLFEKERESLEKEMYTFRNKIDISAVYMNATDRCNGDCPYCYIPEEDRTAGISMDIEDLRASIRKIEAYHIETNREEGRLPVVIFHGSEPMLVKDTVFPVISEFSGRVRFGIQTNATLLEKGDIDFLVKNRVSVGVSLDSCYEEKNEVTRKMGGGKSGYASAVSALKHFDGYKGLSVIVTVSRHNVGDLVEIIRFLHSHRVKAVLMNPVRCTASGTEHMRPDNAELFENFTSAVDASIEINKNHEDKIYISDFTNIILSIVAPTARRLMCDITPCGGGRRFFTVMSDMTTVPCGEFIGLSDFRTMSLKDNSVSEILDSPAFSRVRARTVENIEACGRCLYRNICGAPCPAEVFSATGDLNQPTPYCEYYRNLIDYAFEKIAKREVPYLIRDEMFSGMDIVYRN